MIKKPSMVPATRAYDFYPLGSPSAAALALLTRPLVPRSTAAVRPLPTPVPLPLPPQVMPLAALRAKTLTTVLFRFS
jgi:hypothetical protein